jgi:hypothetical protein
VDKYSKENIIKLVNSSKTYVDVIRKIGLTENAGNYKTIKKYISKYNIDISHFDPYHYQKNDSTNTKKPLSEILTRNSTYKSDKLKGRLFSEGVKSEVCEECGIGNEWNNRKLVLQIDHIDGNPTNNELENLRILCPNCHSQTETFGGNHKNGKVLRCSNELCDNTFYRSSSRIYKNNYCSIKCSHTHKSMKGDIGIERRIVDRPPYIQLKEEIETYGYLATGRKYGVSDNAIRKWIRYYERI